MRRCMSRPVRLALAFAAALAPSLPAQQPSAAPADTARPAAVTVAGLVVPKDARVNDVVVLRGPIDVYGTVTGDAMVVSGDLTIHPGGRVTGDAVSVLGHVRLLDGGTVGGAVHSMAGSEGRRAEAVTPVRAGPENTVHALKLVLGWLTVLVIIGLGVLVTASPYLDGVAEAFEVSFARALGVGIVGQMLVLPAILLACVALALTVVGVLAIPLAIVAGIIAAVGLLTLGFLAVAFVTGRSVLGGERGPTRRRATSARGEALVALSVGIGVYLSVWLGSAALTAVPALAVVLRTIALAITWVAATAGFGAALISRAGTRSESARAARQAAGRATERSPYQSGVPGWQTPTPVHGVVAARRPIVPPTHD